MRGAPATPAMVLCARGHSSPGEDERDRGEAPHTDILRLFASAGRSFSARA
jgi:hypothetical protein